MTDHEQNLLLCILARTVEIESDVILPTHFFRSDWADRNKAKSDLPEIGCRVSGSWLGGDAAGRKRRQRALLGLQSAGLVELFADFGVNTTHVRLTGRGRSAAEALASPPNIRPGPFPDPADAERSSDLAPATHSPSVLEEHPRG